MAIFAGTRPFEKALACEWNDLLEGSEEVKQAKE